MVWNSRSYRNFCVSSLNEDCSRCALLSTSATNKCKLIASSMLSQAYFLLIVTRVCMPRIWKSKSTSCSSQLQNICFICTLLFILLRCTISFYCLFTTDAKCPVACDHHLYIKRCVAPEASLISDSFKKTCI